MKHRLPALGLLAVLGALALGPQLAQSQTRSTYNGTDASFASMMLPHHQGGVKLGKMAAEKGVNADIRRLGRNIVAAQTREIRTLRRMVLQFNTRPSMAPEIERRDEIDMKKLRRASGTEFDRMWLDVISAHHMAAIQMARMEVQGGRNAAARQLARRIVAAQRRELAQFNKLTMQLGG